MTELTPLEDLYDKVEEGWNISIGKTNTGTYVLLARSEEYDISDVNSDPDKAAQEILDVMDDEEHLLIEVELEMPTTLISKIFDRVENLVRRVLGE